MTLGMTLFLTLILAKMYMITHSGYSYSRSFVQSIVFSGVTIALIMIIVGSDVARAFSLVGAMSIIRFRNPIKDSRDIIFIFIAMAIGMACGTYFYLVATIFTFLIIALIALFHYGRFGEQQYNSYVLKIRQSAKDRKEVVPILEKYANRCSIISVNQFPLNQDEEVIYEIDLRYKQRYNDLLSELSRSGYVSYINLLVGESNVSV